MAIYAKNVHANPVYWREMWHLALLGLRGNKVRALLTMLGVIIGSSCIVLVVTVALTGKRFIIAEIEGVGSNLVMAEAINTGISQPLLLADQVNPADLEAIKAGIPEVRYAGGTHDISLTVVVNGVEHPVSLVGVTNEYEQIRKLVILHGRYFDPDDMMTESKVCLLTEELAKAVFPFDNPVGKNIRIGELHFTVIGVFKERVSTFGESEITPESAIVPFSLIKYYTGTNYFKSFYAQADTADDVPLVTSQVEEILQSRHRLGAKYRVRNLTNILETAHYISIAMTVVLVLVAFIALTISGIGIMNIMLVTVAQRTREIGIRKAIGAPRDAILYMFLMEALLVSGTGTVAGIAIAVSIPVLLNFLLSFFPVPSDFHIPISWVSVVLAFVVSCSTGLVFGYLPANRAANLQPTESLRYE
jgi:putative ABC transport system permease protein